jgi:hypothetical protein
MSTGPEQEPRKVSPVIPFEVKDGEIKCTWDNTMIRYFGEGDGVFDHIVHRHEDGSYSAFPLEPAKEEILLREQFPTRFDPLVDEVTLEWASEVMCDELTDFES